MMTKRSTGLFAGLVFLASMVQPLEAAQSPQRSLYTGIFLHDVSSFDQKNGVFDADFDLWVRWRGNFDRDQLIIANGAGVERQFLGEDVDGDWHSARWRVRGTMRGDFPMQRFPMDEQIVAIRLELPQGEGMLLPDLAASGMAEHFSLTDWLYERSFRLAISEKIYPSDLGDLEHEGSVTPANRVAFQVVMIRPLGPVMLKLFLPLLIILLVAIAALFIHPKQVEARSAMGVTALLSCFAFQFTIADALPAVAYLTLADWLFLVAYLVTSSAIVITITSYGFAMKEKVERGRSVDRHGRWVIPTLAVIMIFVALPDPLPEPEPQIDPIEQSERPISGRDSIRIGTNLLSRISGSPLSYGSSWELVEKNPRGRPPFSFVELVPAIDNDALSFLAGGRLQMRWRIREGLTWSDGQPVVADDLLLPLEAEPNELIESATFSDERTLELVWKEMLSEALDPPTIWPSHVLRPVFEAVDEEGNKGGEDAISDLVKTTPTPTLGPYRVTSFEQHKSMTAEVNPHFIGTPPATKNLSITVYEETEDLLAALDAGSIDIILPNSLTKEELLAFEKNHPGWTSIRPSGIHVLLQPDLRHPKLAQVQVRQALMMAIDREAVARKTYGDAGRAAHIPLPMPPPPNTQYYEHDKKKARQILVAANALPMSLKLYHPSSETSTAMAQMIAADLRAVGITLTLEPVRSTMSLWRNANHDGLVLHVQRNNPAWDPERYYQRPDVESPIHDAYPSSVEHALHRLRRSLYPPRQQQLTDAILATYTQTLPSFPLLFAAERMIADPELRNWQHEDPSQSFGNGIEDWFFAIPEPLEEQ